jgi:hypothetical protein
MSAGPGRCFRHVELDNHTAYAIRLLQIDKLPTTDPAVRHEQAEMRRLLREMFEDGHSSNYACPDGE